MNGSKVYYCGYNSDFGPNTLSTEPTIFTKTRLFKIIWLRCSRNLITILTAKSIMENLGDNPYRIHTTRYK